MRSISKSIFAATMALAAGSAAAQSSVTLYGVADVFIQYLNNGGKSSVFERSGGSTGSMVGLKGTEDLGGGLKGVFDLESGFTINNGGLFADSSTLFYRQAWVGLKQDKYGTLTFGRQYQPSFWAVYPTDPFRGNEVLSPLSAIILAAATDHNTLATQFVPGRISNTLMYQSPDVAGAKLYAMYGFAATATQPIPSTSGNMMDIALTWQGAGLYAAMAYMNQQSGEETIAGLPRSLNLLRTEHFTGAVAYRIGIVNLQFNYGYTRPANAAPGSMAALLGAGHALSTAELGATIQATAADSIEAAVVHRNVRGAHDNAVGFQLGVDHNISKRTSFYARAGYMKNNGSSTTSWPGISVTEPDASQTLVVVGMTHRF
ncbi:porin [Paraburkholderia ginsengiterrae]|uniref:Porin n=1 Tax=Paraburkholderia ginsengiterrae TaxID=1462993 RepID=A0A1A9N8G5_9BURK|nr:porin [Paraburkholderia ginsengiterrae]OAJ51631.1 porin [Paraburkholderia ginsengiterrae]OAJ61818.1 porin [Paraburkholderia ginsengiterrae]